MMWLEKRQPSYMALKSAKPWSRISWAGNKSGIFSLNWILSDSGLPCVEMIVLPCIQKDSRLSPLLCLNISHSPDHSRSKFQVPVNPSGLSCSAFGLHVLAEFNDGQTSYILDNPVSNTRLYGVHFHPESDAMGLQNDVIVLSVPRGGCKVIMHYFPPTMEELLYNDCYRQLIMIIDEGGQRTSVSLNGEKEVVSTPNSMIDRISSDMTSMEKSPAPVLSSNAVFSLNSTLIWVHLNVVYVESQPM